MKLGDTFVKNCDALVKKETHTSEKKTLVKK